MLETLSMEGLTNSILGSWTSSARSETLEESAFPARAIVRIRANISVFLFVFGFGFHFPYTTNIPYGGEDS